ncbi:MAG: carboxyl-terminal processing protease [Thermoleophilales bacterium]|nr:carboxyl-terminal processing protease [Thermoleophilales bacterium]
MSPRSSTAWLAAFCVVVAFAAGVVVGGTTGLRDTLGLANSNDRTRAELIDAVSKDFYKPVKKGQLEEASYDGVIQSLHDRFSHYFTPQETKEFNRAVNDPQFEGIGVSVAEDKRGLRVVQVYAGSPAIDAGVLKDDLIVGVNGKSISGQPSDVSTAKIRGKAGTTVRLTVLTPSTARKRELTLKRAKVDIPAADGEMVTRNGHKIAHVQLFGFSSGAHGELRAKLDKLIKDGAEGVVLDLRGNGGGLLREGVLVASTFIEDGVIVSTKGRNRPERKYTAEGTAIAHKLPVVVLVDGGSASASEIVTGALRDSKRATVVGTRTFGKGVFQEVRDLPNGGSLDLTVGSYYLPSGENISGKGIDPTIKAKDQPKTRRDEALPVAIQAVIDKLAR